MCWLRTSDVSLDKGIHIAGLFHEDHVAGVVEDDDLGARQFLGVGGRDDFVLLAPDDQCRRGVTRGEPGTWLVLLGLASEERRREVLQEWLDAVEALVLQHIVDELTADQALVGEELLQHRLQVLAALGCDVAVDIGADLGPQTC